jgi:3-deoxy-D-manno-octulosonate 8-phosphate phosphatase (KDO 8-P phosphatase)
MSKKISLLIFDVDGVLHTGAKTYDKNGDCMSKEWNDRDFSSLKRFRALGIPVAAITGDSWNEGFLQKRKIPYFISRNDNNHISKENFLPVIIDQFKVRLDEIIYIGDDLFDISIMKVLGRENSFCPYNSPKIVQKHCNPYFSAHAGSDCISKLFDFLEDEDRIPKVPFEEIFPKMLALDKEEAL